MPQERTAELQRCVTLKTFTLFTTYNPKSRCLATAVLSVPTQHHVYSMALGVHGPQEGSRYSSWAP